MRFKENSFYHIYNRSFNKTQLFYSTENYHFFKKKLQTLKSLCDILAYCLMPDHFHLLVYIPPFSHATRQTARSSQTGMQELARKIGTILSSYTQAINIRELRRGSLFQPKTKAREIENDLDLLSVFQYIHQNPLRSNLVLRLEDWTFSSFHEYYVKKYELVNKTVTLQFIDLNFEPETFLKQSNEFIPDHLLKNSRQMKHIGIVGAGLVGSLLSIYLVKRGYRVSLFEHRPDMRKNLIDGGRSINMALSNRGIRALELVGLANELKKVAIAMNGRMIHDMNGNLSFQQYGKRGQYINSISRSGLNVVLMDEAEKLGVKIHFNHRCTNVNSKEATATFIVNDKLVSFTFDYLAGADGSFSSVRQAIQHSGNAKLSEDTLAHAYKELTIPPGPGGSFQLEKHALHIWPRNSFMLIALPNPDGNFTCTLFYTHKGKHSFDELKDKNNIHSFFEKNFPDALKLMPYLIDDFNNNPTSTLVTIRCFPWVLNKTFLIGDAAHGIVPFYGQGMNAGFEDCFVLNSLLDQFGDDWEKVLPEYEKLRKPDGDAIAQLALDNFIEMRDHVADEQFLLRKKIEAKLHELYPEKWIPLYSMVTFHENIRYSDAQTIGKRQKEIMDDVMDISNIEEKWESLDFEQIVNQLQKSGRD